MADEEKIIHVITINITCHDNKYLQTFIHVVVYSLKV
jgi:hypothetical protein